MNRYDELIHSDLWYNDFFSEQILKYTFFCNDSGIDSLFFFISFSFFCLDTKEKNKEKIKPADKELQNYGSLR